MQIGPLVDSDLSDALALSEAEEWNQTGADWLRLVHLEPTGCFAARDGQQLIGTVTTTTYGRELSWIGMMIVHREARGQGIGAALMHMALAYLQDKGISDIRLDATPAGRPLYASLGFIVESEFERWQGPVAATTGRSLGGSDDDPTRSVLVLDHAAYGADRSRLLERLVVEAVAKAHVFGENQGAPEGYALARRGRLATYLGPLIAPTSSAAERLLNDIVAQVAGEIVCLDLHMGALLDPGLLAARGLSKRRCLTRMRHGVQTAKPTVPSICASAGPEYG
jgi:GNAT superfamily N-acetyltransferase